MNMDEAIHVSCIIDKLPSSWKDFKHTLKHKKEELTFVELGSHLRITESLKVQDSEKPKGNNIASPSVVNMVEHNNSSRYNDNKGKLKHHDNTRVDPNKKAKPTCWKCGKTIHIKRDCKGTRDEVSNQHPYCFNVEDDPKEFDEAMKLQTSWLQMDLQKRNEGRWNYSKVQGKAGHSVLQTKMIVKTTFLNHELEDEVYMNQSLGFIMPGNENKVDMTKEFLSSRFSIKDIEEADVILRIRIKHESNGIAISQSHYIKKALKKFNYFDDTSEKLMPNNGQAVSQLEYSKVIVCLMYAITCTRLDIAFVVGKLSRYTSNPGTQYWQAIQRVLKYLKKKIDFSLTYTSYPSLLEGYTDASWINNTKDNSSSSGWVFLLGGGVISWASKKQSSITNSIMEFEFVALAAAGKEAEWFKNLLLEIPLWSKPIAPICIRYDSAATLAKAYSQMYNGKSRHLGVRHSMIRDLIINEGGV
ncbi:zinc finger, CCHC-type containing protein [Tanacetum coccineum]|uniref:Zinc finger, CCHC-type containing protein n=1 Tax=Tanacetum coccineum TaxID=301880 RepID=A0ABQ5F8H3_9ASTR